MSRPQLVLKQSTGWFAAGWQFGQALGELSDAAFKLYAWLCLNVDRHTGQLQCTVAELSLALKKPASWTESALRELVERGVCWWMVADVLEVGDQYWPYERQSRRAESKDYVGEVRRERCPTSPEPRTRSPESNDPAPSETKRNEGNEMMPTPPSGHIPLD
jgi:hypothetical protein